MKANNTTKRVKTIEEINAQAERLMQANETWYQDAKRVNREPINRKAQIVAAWHNTKIAAKELQNTPETSDTMNTETTPAMNEVNTVELSPAAYCMDVYLLNDAEIYERYTIPAIGACVGDQTIKAPAMLEYVKEALKVAARMVVKYDHVTPTSDDIQEVFRRYIAYITGCAEYEVKND